MGVYTLLGPGVFDYIKNFFNIIPRVMYFVVASLLSVMDALQLVFRKLAGLDVYYVENVAQTGDVLYEFILGIFTDKYGSLCTLFWSLVVLAIILLFVSTFIAILSNEYKSLFAEGKDGVSNNKWVFVRRAIKGLFAMAIVPVISIFGIYIGNVILQAIDGATSTGFNDNLVVNRDAFEPGQTTGGKTTYMNYDFFGVALPAPNTTFSGMVFKACTFNANRARNSDWFNDVLNVSDQGKTTTNFGIFNLPATKEERAILIDEAFANNMKLKNPAKLNYTPLNDLSNTYYIIEVSDPILNGLMNDVNSFNKFNVGVIWFYYDLWQFDFVIAFASLFFIFKFFLSLCFGLIKRMFMVIGLFVIAPPIAGLYPLDGGKAVSGWSSTFIKEVTSAYSAIAGLNIFYTILPYMNTIKFFPPEIEILNRLFAVILLVAGVSLIDDFVKLISGLIGTKNAGDDGSALQDKIVQNAGQTIGATAGIAKGALNIAKYTPFGVAAKAGIAGAKKMIGNINNRKNTEKETKEEIDFASKRSDYVAENKETVMKAGYQNWLASGKTGTQHNFETAYAGGDPDANMAYNSAEVVTHKKIEEQALDSAYNTYVANAGAGASNKIDWESTSVDAHNIKSAPNIDAISNIRYTQRENELKQKHATDRNARVDSIPSVKKELKDTYDMRTKTARTEAANSLKDMGKSVLKTADSTILKPAKLSIADKFVESFKKNY
ncbi:MAG: hypothetical protein RR140_02175 [Clostridia bacterium]